MLNKVSNYLEKLRKTFTKVLIDPIALKMVYIPFWFRFKNVEIVRLIYYKVFILVIESESLKKEPPPMC